MPAGGDRATVCEVPSISARLALRTFGVRLLAAAPGTAALIEWRSGAPPWLGIFPSSGPAHGSSGLSWVAEPGVGTIGPTPGPCDLGPSVLFGLLEPGGAAGQTAPTAGAHGLQCEPSVAVPPPIGRWAIQLHLWSGGRPGHLSGSLRFGVEGDGPGAEHQRLLLGMELAGALRVGLGAPTLRAVPAGRSARKEFRLGSLRRFRSRALFELSPADLGELAAVGRAAWPNAPEPGGHRVVLGSTGAGKTALLAHWAAGAIARGEPIVVLDVHGDLAPAIVARLGPSERDRVVALDATTEARAAPGIDLLGGPASDGLAPRLVAALRRGSDDEGTRYWGFRLERIFDEFVRLALEEGGNLRDLYALLTDDRRREASRLATASPERARFLEELAGILRRNPEFLWPAAARISKLMMAEPLTRLVAPVRATVEPESIARDRRALVVRLPMGQLGPEAARLAATLLLARIYLDRTAPREDIRRVRVVIDEAHALAPSLLGEVLTEGRKFGVELWLATQFPGRLDPDLREAAGASAVLHLALRTPAPAAASVAGWLGLGVGPAIDELPSLPVGSALVLSADRTRPIVAALPAGSLPPSERLWAECVDRTVAEFGDADSEGPDPDRLADRLFEVRREELAQGSADVAAPEFRPLARRGWVVPEGLGARTTRAGRAALGEEGPTGATRESAEHRALLAAAFRLFARCGLRLELVRQGRFDTRLPDARYRWLSDTERRGPAGELGHQIGERASRWGFRAFGGRDVFVEAEVTGARRPDRIRRDLAKARTAGAHCLFVVGTSADADRVRRLLRATATPGSAASVWVLRRGLRGPDPDEGAGSFARPE